MEEYILRTFDLTKTFSGKPAVDRVNLNVRKGDIYGFIGRNGAGKTTLMRMVAGLAGPPAGGLELFGTPDLKAGRIRTGCAIESPALYPNLTAAQTSKSAASSLGIPEKQAAQRVLEIVGLLDTGKKNPKFFAGHKQRLAIAIALLGNPDFLILDEPINGLDPTGIKEMRDLFVRLRRDHGITILISSHILGELSKIATRYGIINKGVLVDEFSAEELENRCRRCLRIQVDDVKRAVYVIETILGTTNYDVLPENVIRLFEFLDEAGRVNTELSKNDVVVESISVAGQDLEGYFMELMGGIGYAESAAQ
ncbi:MAG: ATP-binding cassette domain-containing protein [Oscillospiraceae bacterium]